MLSRIIKANSVPSVTTVEGFNFIDLERQSEDVIAAARKKAGEILDAAKIEAETIRQNALIEGRTKGLAQADELIAERANGLAEQRVTDRLVTALPSLRSAAESLQAERDRWLIRWEETAVRLGVAIAEKLIHRQLASRPELATEMITDALRLAAGQPQLTVHLHPDDLEAWGDRAPQIIQSLTACADTTLVPDLDGCRGSCRIETRHGEIDARVETMLHRIAEELVDG